MTTPLLAVEDLNVWFEPGRGAERGAVGFELEAGERFGLVGESGCGKTTAMLSIMGLLLAMRRWRERYGSKARTSLPAARSR